MLIIKPIIVPSETTTKYLSHVTNLLPSANRNNISIECPSGYPTGYPNTIRTGNTSSNPVSHPISDTDTLKRGIQEIQVSLKRSILLFILCIISSLSSRQRVIQACRRGGLRISHIRVHKLYYETQDLFPSTKSRIYGKDKCERLKVILYYIIPR